MVLLAQGIPTNCKLPYIYICNIKPSGQVREERVSCLQFYDILHSIFLLFIGQILKQATPSSRALGLVRAFGPSTREQRYLRSSKQWVSWLKVLIIIQL